MMMSVFVYNRYCEKTREDEESIKRNLEIIEYIDAQRVLASQELVKSIGYDGKNVEYYIFFGQKYMAITDPTMRKQNNNHIKTVLKFIAKRKRLWSLIFFD